MSHFGYISPLLLSFKLKRLEDWLPCSWRYWRGPKPTGDLIGRCGPEQLQGTGWVLPEDPGRIWDRRKMVKFWEKLMAHFRRDQIKVIGLDNASVFHPPTEIKNQQDFPGVSDGKTLELIIFLNRFRGMLRNHEISPQKAKALIIWEEGNLGLTCARLIARDLRFLILVNPHLRLLERAADLILSETGISPQLYLTPPLDYKGAKIVIKCGGLSKYELPRTGKHLIKYELFQSHPSLPSLNVNLPLTVADPKRRLPMYPALGETMLRAAFDLNYGYWFGTELPLERVLKLAVIFKELGMELIL